MIKDQLLTALNRVGGPSSFAYGSEPKVAPNPGLCITELGLVGFPLSSRDREAIIDKSRQSPFGKGEQTLVDTNVRRSWEIDAAQIQLTNPAWDKFVDDAISEVYHELALTCGRDNVTAELYKLLIYEEGAFFKSHQDSEKTSGMFGTFVIVLPSPHEGGDVRLSHNKQSLTFKSSKSPAFHTSFAAWYADVYHEILRVTSGHRVVLTYNLVQKSRDTTQAPPSAQANSNVVEEILQKYETCLDVLEQGAPPYLLYELEHHYSAASLKLDSLKGNDHKQVSVLQSAASKLGFEIYLACMELEVQKDDEALDQWDKSAEIARSTVFTNIVQLNGEEFPIKPVFDESCLLKSKNLREEDPDEEEHSEWTGNEGETAVYWYRDTAVVIVPPSRSPDFRLDGANFSYGLELLLNLKSQCKNDRRAHKQLQRLCRLVMSKASRSSEHRWRSGYSRHGGKPAVVVSEAECVEAAADVALSMGWPSVYAMIPVRYRLQPNILASLGRYFDQCQDNNARDLLVQISNATSGLSRRFEGLKAVKAAFDLSSPSEASVNRFTVLYNSVLAEIVSRDVFFSKKDAHDLAEICHSGAVDVTGVLQPLRKSGRSPSRIAFARHWLHLSGGMQELKQNKEDMEKILELTLTPLFQFGSTLRLPMSESDALTIDDLVWLLEVCIAMDSSWETQCLHAMTNAISGVDIEYLTSTIFDFLKAIMHDEVEGLSACGSEPELALSNFVKECLCTIVEKCVGKEPPPPKDWRIAPGSCSCSDCSQVNAFMASHTQIEFYFPASQRRRDHICQVYGLQQSLPYRMRVIKQGSPHVLNIFKTRSQKFKVDPNWEKSLKATQAKIKSLLPKNSTKLQLILGADFDAIMSCKVDQLPARESRMPLSPVDTNTRRPTNKKRPHDDVENGGDSVQPPAKSGRVCTREVIDLT